MTLGRNFHKSCRKHGGSSGWKPGGAARRHIFAILDKLEGAFKRPPPLPAGRGLRYELWLRASAKRGAKRERPTLTSVFSWDSQVCGVSVKVGSVPSKIPTFIGTSRNPTMKSAKAGLRGVYLLKWLSHLNISFELRAILSAKLTKSARYYPKRQQCLR